MVYNYNDVYKKYGSAYQINKAVKEKKIYKIDSGIYSNKENNHYLEVFTKKYPDAIISGDSAYYYHNLIDVIPPKIFITTKRNATRFNDKHIEQSYTEDKYFGIGKTHLDYEGVNINIYDKERMLIELVKNKNNISYDYYKEIINNYRKIKDDLDIFKIEDYANIFPNSEKIMGIIQDEVF